MVGSNFFAIPDNTHGQLNYVFSHDVRMFKFFICVYNIICIFKYLSLYIYIYTQFLCIMKKNTHDFQGFPISTMNTYPGDAKVTCEKSLVFQVTQPQNRFTLMMLLMPLTKMTPHSFRQTKGRKNNSLLGDSFVENRWML